MNQTYNKPGHYAFALWIILLTLSVIPLYGQYSGSQVTLHRFALIIGSNNGGNDRQVLRYATKDALSFARVMKEMGAVYDENVIILLDPEKDDIFSAFKEMRDKVSAYTQISGRKELLVYYSGHSNEEGLLLFENNVSYKRFRDEISSVNADVRVAILDSCSSGAFTRTKGVIRQPPFLVDSSSKMEGYAFLTSSAEDEAAQESDSIQASFFTHYLVSGLRGAADTSKDGMVSLNEAYTHAFSETLARTEKTQYGPQHPKYDIQLTGTGDLVLTDLRETSASLLLAEELEGRFFIRDKSGNLVVELRKNAGHVVELGLEPGKYGITLDLNNELFQSTVVLNKNARKFLQFKHLNKVDDESAVARGDTTSLPETGEETTSTSETTTDEKRIIPFHYSFFPPFFESGGMSNNYAYTVSLNLLLGNAMNIEGFQAASIGNVVKNHMYGTQLGGLFNLTSGYMYGFQGSGIGNIAGDEVEGFQGAGIFNFAAGNTRFLQGAGIINITLGTMSGVQLAGIVNVTGKGLSGFQGSGIGNYSTSVDGAQAAGIINISGGHVDGFQGAGVCNVSSNTISGVQIAGVSNYSANTDGTQIAGVLNLTGELKGFQGGLINVAGKVSGIQLGLINIAEEYTKGIPIGLFSFERNGLFAIDVWYDRSGYTNLGFKFGTKFTYALITSSVIIDSEPVLWSYGFGYGIHLPFSRFSFEADVTCNVMSKDDDFGFDKEDDIMNLLPRARGSFGVNIGNFFTLFAGCSFDMYFPSLYYDFPENSWEWNRDIFGMTEPVYIAPVFFSGISIHL